jgi:tRNA-Thr(GGU) m(6)t(6)A37 methyltransferase TsaA
VARDELTAVLRPVGHIETPYQDLEDCPNHVDAAGPVCCLVVDPRFQPALMGLGPGDRIAVLYWFEGVDRERLQQLRRGVGPLLGTFALRSPHRPNPVALAEVTIESIDDNRVEVRGLDCLDGTPLIDIKPVIRRGEAGRK